MIIPTLIVWIAPITILSNAVNCNIRWFIHRIIKAVIEIVIKKNNSPPNVSFVTADAVADTIIVMKWCAQIVTKVITPIIMIANVIIPPVISSSVCNSLLSLVGIQGLFLRFFGFLGTGGLGLGVKFGGCILGGAGLAIPQYWFNLSCKD
ncbi:hypothetical protein F8M41_007836 [Gigaspora margarita]|uniref:Uncharacterized protein n=1 Tax=Gigaspora margarita TaxID=4874 RepID=A0A8H4EQZ2_GIGMA|nr:hypothetical protein F8M41_007836 [Gigaspora margarita]